MREINVKAFNAAAASNETVSKQADPISMFERREIAKKLRQQGGVLALTRAAVLQLNGAALGRPSDVVGLSPDVFHWDYDHHCLVAQWAQIKTHQYKIVLFGASNDRLICALCALATAYAGGSFKNQLYDDDGMNLLFPFLSPSSSSTSAQTQITTWVRQMTQESLHAIFRTNR